ncbi:hypothetical protein BGZ51_000260 [Haplosporangium sp. Z 767]|nr:hypothetical protein BGZ50_000886 [Haplosporangium sp. Z 11]KAF9176606.1 hypothetical protein BGZ51_000260 [Haplosporangium sp. Z 767]
MPRIRPEKPKGLPFTPLRNTKQSKQPQLHKQLKQRRNLIIAEKAAFIKEFREEQGRNPYASRNSIAKLNGVNPKTARSILDKADFNLRSYERLPSRVSKSMMCIRHTKIDGLDEMLKYWF